MEFEFSESPNMTFINKEKIDISLGVKDAILPILILSTFVFLNFSRFEDSLLRGMIHVLLQTSLIYGVIFLVQNIVIRIALSLFITIELFSQLSYSTSLTISSVMSILNTSANEFFSFIEFNIFSIIASLLFVLGMLFFKVPERRIIPALCLIGLGASYVLFPAAISSEDIFSSPKYEDFIQTGLAKGLSKAVTSAAYLIKEELAPRMPPLQSILGITDTFIFLLQQAGSESSWKDVKHRNNSPSILVLGIGESLRANNMGLYGYNRNTTPYLSALTKINKLNVYSNAYSAGTNTWNSVPASLTLAKYDGTPDITKSIINLAKDAGYETYWLSNHAKLSGWDFSVSSLAGQTKHIFFASNEQAGSEYDESLVSKLHEILKIKDDEDKLFIILHFYGSHMSFLDRYPPEFSLFENGELLLDQYDNSILYSDFINTEVLKLVSEFGGEYIFFADHGLGDPNGDIPLKHDVRDNPNLSSLKVPFFSSHHIDFNMGIKEQISLYYFECIFSQWSGITSTDLTDNNYCHNALSRNDITFINSNLELQVFAP